MSTMLGYSVELNPANSFAKLFLAQAYYHQHRYKAVSDLYRNSSPKDFQISPEVMAQIAVSLWDIGGSNQAKTVLQSARTLFPEGSLLAATALLFSKAKNQANDPTVLSKQRAYNRSLRVS